MKVLVCGGRSYQDWTVVGAALDHLAREAPIDILITGGAKGCDWMAGTWALDNNVPLVQMPAGWKAAGKAAGPRRNANMLRLMQPDLVVAFPGGKGTADMVAKARLAGVDVREIAGR